MLVFILLGWIVGLVLGAIAAVMALLALGVAMPALLNALGTALAPVVAALGPLALAAVVVFVVLCFVAAYQIATVSIAPLLPAGATFPLTFTFPTPMPVTLTATPGEFFARGVLIGLNAAISAILLVPVPGVGLLLAGWAFVLISLAAVLFVARNRVYQGFLGWSGWLFPMSWLATAVGLLLFVVNAPFAFTLFGLGAFAIDWTTGVIETRGGLVSLGTGRGFSLGNFTFLMGATAAGAAAGRFTAPSVSSHETGHSLNTAAMGGVVLWINAVDENIVPGRANLAYGELCAEGHSRNMPGTPINDFSLRLWF